MSPTDTAADQGAKAAPHVSVIIPAYNAAAFVVQAVQSALRQAPHPPQVIVIDDGSKDNTAELVAALEGVTLIRQENAGAAAARAAGLAKAEGSFILFLDSDDLLLPGAIAAHLTAMQAHPDAAMVYGANDRIDAKGNRIASYPQPVFESREAHFVAHQVTPTPSQCLYRAKALEAVGGYDPNVPLCEDCDLNIRICAVGSIVSHGEMVLSYRIHGGQATQRPSKNCDAHLDILHRHLGPDGQFSDAAALKRSLKKWKRYYGQLIPIEIIKTALRRDMSGALTALKTFLICLPQSGIGALQYGGALLRRRFGKPAGAS